MKVIWKSLFYTSKRTRASPEVYNFLSCVRDSSCERGSQLVTSFPPDKVVLVRENISAIKLPRCRPIKNLGSAGNRESICIYVLNVSFLSRDDENLACRVSLTRRGIYIRARVRCRASAARVFMRAVPGCSKAEEKGGKMGIRNTQLSYLRALLAHYSDCRHHPRLSWLSRRVTWYSLRTFAAGIRVGANRGHTCVHSCVRAFRASLTKSRVPYLRKCTMRTKETREESRWRSSVTAVWQVSWRKLVNITSLKQKSAFGTRQLEWNFYSNIERVIFYILVSKLIVFRTFYAARPKSSS